MSFKDTHVDPSERVRDAEKVTRLIDNTHIGIYDNDHRDFFKQLDKQLKDVKGILPGLDLTGFDQEAVDHSTGLTKLWHGIKEAFGGHHKTLDDQIQEKVVEKMKNSSDPKEQAKYKAYAQEEEALQHWKDEVKQRQIQMGLLVGEDPERPKTPMHDMVEQRAQAQEKKIIAEVRSHMTPAEIAKVDADIKTYAEGVEEAHTIHNPIGTGEGFKPLPTPSADLAKYWRHIQEQTDVDTGY